MIQYSLKERLPQLGIVVRKSFAKPVPRNNEQSEIQPFPVNLAQTKCFSIWNFAVNVVGDQDLTFKHLTDRQTSSFQNASVASSPAFLNSFLTDPKTQEADTQHLRKFTGAIRDGSTLAQLNGGVNCRSSLQTAD